MTYHENVELLLQLKERFEKLQKISYKSIFVNDVIITIMGIHYMDCSPEWNVRRHRHSFFEFHYIAIGETYTTINTIERKIKQGIFYILPPGTYHSHRQDSSMRHIGFALRWEIRKVGDGINNKGNRSIELDRAYELLLKTDSKLVCDDGTVIGGVINLLKLSESGAGILQLQFVFLNLLMDIVRAYTHKGKKENTTEDYVFFENETVNNAIGFIEENYNQDIDVTDVSNSVHLSYSQLSRLFLKYSGETINNHLNRVRLLKAQQLLMCSGKTVAQIAREVGFNNEHYLCTAFKKQFWVSPGKYRKGNGPLQE